MLLDFVSLHACACILYLSTVLDCGEPPELENGKVATPHTTTCGSEVTYSCNNGYLLEGVSSRTCEPNQQWSNGTTRCERMLNCIAVYIGIAIYTYLDQ